MSAFLLDGAPAWLARVDWIEVAAAVITAISVLLAGRNSVHTWWTGIVGALVYAEVFYRAKLYADVALQGFFVVTSALGWWAWLHGDRGRELPVRRSTLTVLVVGMATGAVCTGLYGWMLRAYTDAYAPFLDSVILAFSVLGQVTLMARRVESWWCWLLVNTIAVPLYGSRGLYPTTLLYAVFWLNAWWSLRHWSRLAARAA